VSYPVTHLALTAEEARGLRDRHASGDDAAVLARVRELAASSAEQLTLHRTWEPIRRCLVGSPAVRRAESVFGRRDYLIELAEAAEVAATAAALAEMSLAWLRARFDERVPPSDPGLVQPDHSRDFGEVWEAFARYAGFFARADRAQRSVLTFTGSRFWRPPRRETGPDGRTRVVRPAYRPQDYTVDPSAVRSLPAGGGTWPLEADLNERDGALYSWTEVERFIRGGRTWVRLTNSDSEYYIDVEDADGYMGRIECVDPLIAYWLARRADACPVVLED
jgi:hypothetical protein